MSSKYSTPSAFQRAIEAVKRDEEVKDAINEASKASVFRNTEVTRFFRIQNDMHLVEYTFKGYDIIFHFFKKKEFYSVEFEARLRESFSKWPGKVNRIMLDFHNGPESVFDSSGEIETLQSWNVIVVDPCPHPSDSGIRAVVSRIINV